MTGDALEFALAEFIERLNHDDVARRMLADWRRRILVEAVDTGGRFVLVSTGTGAGDLEIPRDPGDAVDMRIFGGSSVLVDIFMGRRDPIDEYMAGRLRFQGMQADEIRLDAVVACLWDDAGAEVG